MVDGPFKIEWFISVDMTPRKHNDIKSINIMLIHHHVDCNGLENQNAGRDYRILTEKLYESATIVKGGMRRHRKFKGEGGGLSST